MSEIITTTSSAFALPSPRVSISIRTGVESDIPFIDALQKKQVKNVGFMFQATLQGKIKLGHVLIAEEQNKIPVGYCIGNDRYFKRDDVGVIYQMNVVPEYQRSLVGASLLKAMFERSAYGCKLFCLWCAQDIPANKFWESLGFVPLAFRTGGEKKGPKGSPRVHIFWQKRIRAGDTTTPYWFPSKTDGGLLRADRIVLPIQPGMHWSEIKPFIAPQDEQAIPASAPPPKRVKAPPMPKRNAVRKNGMWYDIPSPEEAKAIWATMLLEVT
jgi:N-acetylglutamate synthase-like GNAT family acetyltransferase